MTNEEKLSGTMKTHKLGSFCETPTAFDLRNLFRVCHLQGELGIVTGEPGVGKTTAIQDYIARTPLAYVATLSPAKSRLVQCLECIGESIGAWSSGAGAGAWSNAIRSRLRGEYDPQVLLIDEAQHLADESLEEVRSIFDATSIGVVFIGSREIRERWSGRRWAQLTSRIYQRIDIEGPIAGDIDAICEAYGIEGKRARDKLHRAARLPGGLRVVKKIIQAATALAGPNTPLTAAHIDTAFDDREGGQ